MFGIKTAKRVEELSTQMVIQSEKHLTEIKELVEGQELQIKAASRHAFLTQFNNFNTQIFPHYNVVKQQLVYQTLDDLYSVVSRVATACAMIPFYPELKNGDDVQENDKIYDFLRLLTLDQRIAAYTYILLQGEIFIYKDKLSFGINAGIQKITVLNPANVTVFISQGFPTEITGFRYWDGANGSSVDIDVEDMVFVKMFNPDGDINQQVRGLSPVRVLAQRLTRVKAALDVSVAQMQNGGVPGIVYDKMPGYEVGAMGQRKESFARFQNNPANKGAPYFAQGEMGYLAIGSTLADMDLAELASMDLDKICNVYHVSSTEFNNKSSSTESNVKQLGKGFITNGVLPVVALFRDGLNSQALPDVKTQAILKEDISDIPELQKDLKATADAMAAIPFVIPNDVFEKMGYKRKPDPIYDEVWVKSGYTLMEDALAVDPLQNTAGDYQQPVVPLKQAVK